MDVFTGATLGFMAGVMTWALISTLFDQQEKKRQKRLDQLMVRHRDLNITIQGIPVQSSDDLEEVIDVLNCVKWDRREIKCLQEALDEKIPRNPS